MGIVDEVIPEPLGGAHRDHFKMATTLKGSLVEAFQKFDAMSVPQLLEHRYQRFRKMGVFHENAAG